MSDKSTKKIDDDDELAEEYDLANIPKGHYAPERRLRKNLVVLDADLAQAFPNDEAVNKALRLVVQISHIPQTAATP
jgi:hypothetical protein